MRLKRFYALTYAVAFEIDGKEHELVMPYDGALYSTIMERAEAECGVRLPFKTQDEWFAMLNKFIADAIEDGIDIGPISRTNRILTDRDPDPRRH